MKTCSKCGDYKQLEDFSPDKRAVTGRQSQCRDCCSRSKRDRRQECPEIFKKHYANRYEKLRSDPELWAEHLKKQRARVANNPEAKKNWAKRDNAKRSKLKNKWQCQAYAADPYKAAERRAKNSLSQSMGLPNKELPRELVEAKAAQLLVRRYVTKGK